MLYDTTTDPEVKQAITDATKAGDWDELQNIVDAQVHLTSVLAQVNRLLAAPGKPPHRPSGQDTPESLVSELHDRVGPAAQRLLKSRGADPLFVQELRNAPWVPKDLRERFRRLGS